MGPLVNDFCAQCVFLVYLLCLAWDLLFPLGPSLVSLPLSICLPISLVHIYGGSILCASRSEQTGAIGAIQTRKQIARPVIRRVL